MNERTDLQLLSAWAKTRSEPAFAELVRRHLDLIYSAALRMVCDPHLAEDVTQAVFCALAKSAAQLSERHVLSGWLHRTAQNIAAQTVRSTERRRAREQEAVAMNQLLATESETPWEHIAPQLDAALGELSEPDRDAVLLRYFENKSLREVGQALGTSDDTAQKRVSRAVERLREFFAKRGVTVGASGLVVVISANAVQAAPVGLAVTISTAVTAAAITTATIAATATATATKAVALTALHKTIIGAALIAVVVATVILQQQSRSRTRKTEPTAPQPADGLASLQVENDRVPNVVARSNSAPDQSNELLNRVEQAAPQPTDELASLQVKNAPVPSVVTRSNSSPDQPSEPSKPRAEVAVLRTQTSIVAALPEKDVRLRQPFAGKWTNTDFSTRGVTRIEIRLDGERIIVHMWGRCHPTECDWGETTASLTGQTLSLTWKRSWSVNTQELKLLADGKLQLTGHVHYTDKRKREDHDINGVFAKGLVHNWSSRASK